MELIKSLLSNYGLDTFAIAICTVIVTGILKIPIKVLSRKTKNSKKITRFITFMPIIIGFGLTVITSLLLKKIIVFNQHFFERWLSAVSLSLAVYAIWEQFVPSSKKIMSDAEIKANQELIVELKEKLINSHTTEIEVTECAAQPVEQPEEVKAITHRRIILTNHKNKKN